MDKKIKIFIVDDHQDDVQFISTLLKQTDFSQHELSATDNLIGATEYLLNNTVDLILLNLELKDSQGLQTFRCINNYVFTTPIIILSEPASEQIAKAAITLGAQDYLLKNSFNARLLNVIISTAIESERAERQLQEYASILHYASIGIINIDLEGKIISWNKMAENIFGFSKKEIIGKAISILSANEEGNQVSNLANKLKEKESIQYEATRIRKDKTRVDVLIYLTPIKDKLGRIVGLSKVCQDITLRKLSEQELAIEFRVAKALSESSNLYNAGYIILKICCDTLGWKLGEIWAPSASANLQPVCTWGENNTHLSAQNHIEIVNQVYKNKKMIWLEEISESDIKGCCGFPILVNDEIMGVLIFWGMEIKYPKNKLMQLFTAICNQIGVFIKRKHIEGDLLYLSQHDTLTGLSNRIAFEDALNKAIMHAHSQKTSIALLYLDLDYFKNINDRLGHDSGDQLLQHVAQKLKNTIRESDSIARFGGDEFAIFLPNIRSQEDVVVVTQKVSAAIAEPFHLEGNDFFASVSIGISLYPDDGLDVKTLLKNADMAMYQAKKNGRNSAFYTPSLQEKNKKILDLENDLYHALEREEFFLHYQPIVNCHNNEIEGMEVLIRWRHSSGNILLPDEFIPLAEQSRLILSIGNWVVKTICQQIKKNPLVFKLPIYINISVKQLYENFVENIEKILEETGVDTRSIVLEVTESTLIKHTENTLYILSSLKKLGIEIALDDFGTGYSSLNYLQNFSVSNIKIDKSFISGLPHNPGSAAIVTAMIAMAHALNIKVTAEGVETQAQLNWLKEKQCDRYQGFLFSHPVPETELLHVLNQNE